MNIAAVSEALVLAQKAGADPKKVYEAVRDGFAGSRVLDEKAPMMYSRNFKPGGTIAINLKDITNVMDTAKSLDVPLDGNSSANHVELEGVGAFNGRPQRYRSVL